MAYEELIARLEAPWSRVTAIEERTYANGRVEMVNPLLREAAAALRWLQNSAAATDEAITWANGHLDTIIAERDALRVEVAALKKDAERYRWLKQVSSSLEIDEAAIDEGVAYVASRAVDK